MKACGAAPGGRENAQLENVEPQRARSGACALATRRYAPATRVCATLLVPIGIALLYGAWGPFVQAANVDVQFTAAIAIADYLNP